MRNNDSTNNSDYFIVNLNDCPLMTEGLEGLQRKNCFDGEIIEWKCQLDD